MSDETSVLLRLIRRLTLVATSLSVVSIGTAQLIHLETPIQTTDHSFYESTGVGWSFQKGNFRFDWPGGNALPQFGGFDPNEAANLGFGVNGRGGRFRLNLTMAQGSSTTRTTASPSLVIPNGGFGFLNNTINRPFVTSFVPVVNDGFFVPTTSPIQARLARLASEPLPPVSTPRRKKIASQRSNRIETPSSAEFGDISVEEIRRQVRRRKAVESQQLADKVRKLIAHARNCESQGKWGAARDFYRSAIRQSTEETREKIQEQLSRVEAKIAQEKRGKSRGEPQ